MDIWLIGTGDSIQIRPASIHGMLWLQTHFEDAHWDSLASSQVRLPQLDAEALSQDAKNAGMSLGHLSALSVPGRF